MTAPEITDWTAEFYEGLGKQVIRLRREVVGHIVSRLQAGLFREALSLVADGVATVDDIDRGIAYGPGLRWAVMGPFLNFHLAAGEGGIAAYLNHLGVAYERMWADLGTLDQVTDSLIDRVAAQTRIEAAGRSIDELVGERDAVLVPLIRDALQRSSAAC